MPEMIDSSEVKALAADLAGAPARVIPAVMPVARRAGVNIKRRMRSDASGHRHLPGLARAVEYDIVQTPVSVTVEVGFRDQGQGELASIAAFGTSKNAPVMEITRGLADEVPAFMRFAAKAAAGALR